MCRHILHLILILALASGCNLSDSGPAGSDAGGDTEDSSSTECVPGETQMCDGECVAVDEDPEHCGACGNRCADDERNTACIEPTCDLGTCTFDVPSGAESCAMDSEMSGVCAGVECVECGEDTDCVDPPTSHSICWEATCADDQTCEYVVPDPNQECGGSTCENGLFREPDLCGEAGSCNLRDPGTPCEPYRCNDAGDACTTTCEADADCVGGSVCLEAECLDELPVDLVIDSDRKNVIVSSLLVDEYGWSETLPVVGSITIADGAAIGSTDPTTPALVVDSLPEDSELTIRVEGMILGAGGDGGDALANGGEPSGFNAPGDGGTALQVEAQPPDTVVRIDNDGIIGGGGGGGAAGSTYVFNLGITMGGGGGAGFAPGEGGSADPAQVSKDGSDGTRTQGGAGGRNEGAGGGRGGHLGQRGGPVDDLQQSSSRGDGGAAVVGASYLEWTRTGDVRGAIQP